jgi:FkbM family methyltransferase
MPTDSPAPEPQAPVPGGRLPKTIRIVTIVLPIALLVLTGAGLTKQWHLPLLLSHYLHGRVSTCSLSESLEGVRLSEFQASESERLNKTAHVISVDPKGFKLWETAHGTYWEPANSEEAVAYDLAEQEREIYGVGEMGVHAGDVVLDCGANVGVFTRKALDLGARLVIAIEPAPENVECLRRNFAKEVSEGRVLVYPKGVWNKDDVLRMRVDPANSAQDTLVRPATPGVKYEYVDVPLTTVDNMMRELKLEKADFIKMDIEGAEQKAIAGARETIGRYRPRMALCIYHLPDDAVMVPKLVAEIVPNYRVKTQCLCAPDLVQPQVAHFY